MAIPTPLVKKLFKFGAIALIGLTIVTAVTVTTAYFVIIRMPGSSYDGPLPALTDGEKALSQALRRDVEKLATEIGLRSVGEQYDALKRAEQFITESFAEAGYQVRRQEYDVDGKSCANLEATLTGTTRPDELFVVGAHYDSASPAPGADDNATGVAGVLALARGLSGAKLNRSIRFVAFVNEEPPYFQKETMGSLVYAREQHHKGEKIVGAMVLEMLGYYSDEPNSQRYPPTFNLFYPSVGNFIAFVGNIDSRSLLHDVIESFRSTTAFPSEGTAAPNSIRGVGFSDHWSFWQIDVPAVMVTDMAFYRNEHYHKETDTADTLDFDRMARVVAGLERVIRRMD